jgi:hypothetical protein
VGSAYEKMNDYTFGYWAPFKKVNYA